MPRHDKTPLFVAAGEGHVGTVRVLLGLGATQNGHLDVVQCLLAHHATVDGADQEGVTPLLWPRKRATWTW